LTLVIKKGEIIIMAEWDEEDDNDKEEDDMDEDGDDM